MKLLCFPYAGASGSVFLKWKKYSDKEIVMIPIDPPGRGARMAEPLCTTVDEAVEDLRKQVLEIIDNREEYAIYGHSMGCLLIYELLHKLLDEGKNMPVHVFLSGKNPPDVPVRKSISRLEDAEFMDNVAELGGTDTQFFENPVLVKLYLPILRKDFGMLESYVYRQKRKLPVDLSFFFSSEDKEVAIKHVRRWADFISGYFYLYHFDGDHFFIFENQDKIMEIINNTLSEEEFIAAY